MRKSLFSLLSKICVMIYIVCIGPNPTSSPSTRPNKHPRELLIIDEHIVILDLDDAQLLVATHDDAAHALEDLLEVPGADEAGVVFVQGVEGVDEEVVELGLQRGPRVEGELEKWKDHNFDSNPLPLSPPLTPPGKPYLSHHP